MTGNELAHEIREMARVDQDMRRVFAEGGTYDPEVDRRNTERMRAIVDELGWPGASLVGAEGAHWAWLLVQHADHDVAFQERCLDLMRSQPAGEVSPADIAYLEDRVAVSRGRPQRYGTQFRVEADGAVVPSPLEDRGRVDEWRARVGLQAFAEYAELVRTRQRRER